MNKKLKIALCVTIPTIVTICIALPIIILKQNKNNKSSNIVDTNTTVNQNLKQNIIEFKDNNNSIEYVKKQLDNDSINELKGTLNIDQDQDFNFLYSYKRIKLHDSFKINILNQNNKITLDILTLFDTIHDIDINEFINNKIDFVKSENLIIHIDLANIIHMACDLCTEKDVNEANKKFDFLKKKIINIFDIIQKFMDRKTSIKISYNLDQVNRINPQNINDAVYKYVVNFFKEKDLNLNIKKLTPILIIVAGAIDIMIKKQIKPNDSINTSQNEGSIFDNYNIKFSNEVMQTYYSSVKDAINQSNEKDQNIEDIIQKAVPIEELSNKVNALSGEIIFEYNDTSNKIYDLD